MSQWIARRFRAIQVITDISLLALSWAAAFFIRFYYLKGAQEGLVQVFLYWFFPLGVLSLYFLLKNEHYNSQRLFSFPTDMMQILRANSFSVVAFVVLLYFAADARISRLTILLYAALSTVLLIGVRIAFRSFTRKLRRRGFLLKRVFVVGDSDQVEKYLETIRYTPGAGMRVEAVFGGRQGLAWNGRTFSLDTLDEKIRIDQPDIVVLGFSDPGATHVGKFLSKYYDSLFLIQVLPTENQTLLGLTTEMVEDLHVLSLNQPQFTMPELFAKRTLDVMGSGLGLFLLSPVFLLLALLVRLSSPGPIFFGQERVGRDGRKFKMWKFRSMRQQKDGEPNTGWTVENDPRRTTVGTFLRATSLDEFPQLWNVFVGDMSLVGPRPEQTFFVDRFRSEIPAYMLRHKMKAGMTGWAQVNGWRGDTSLHKRIECDLYYIRNWTVWFDLKILILTFVKGFTNRNAY